MSNSGFVCVFFRVYDFFVFFILVEIVFGLEISFSFFFNLIALLLGDVVCMIFVFWIVWGLFFGLVYGLLLWIFCWFEEIVFFVGVVLRIFVRFSSWIWLFVFYVVINFWFIWFMFLLEDVKIVFYNYIFF